jgi:hypothetical protein
MTDDEQRFPCTADSSSATAVPYPGVLRAHSLYACPRWLEVLERGGRAADYVTSGQPGAPPIGVLPLHLTSPTRNSWYSPEHLLRGLPSDTSSWSFAGPVSAYQTDIATVVDDPFDEAAALLVRRAREVATGRHLILPYLTTTAVERLSPPHTGTLLLENFDCWIETPAWSLEQYRQVLPSRRRKAIDRDLRAFTRSGLHAGAECLRDDVDAFAQLVVNNSAKYGNAGDHKALSRHLAHIADMFGDAAVLFTARNFGGDLVGGVLAIRHGDVLYMRMSGFDYTATADASAYFVLAYYMPVEHRLQHPYRRAHHGIGALRTKHLHGARLEPLWSLLLGPEIDPRTVDRVNNERFTDLTRDLPEKAAIPLRHRLAGR